MRRQLLILSLVANLGLVAAVAWRIAHRPASPVAEQPAPTPAPLENTPALPAPGPATTYITNETRANFSWNLLEAADYKQYIANLRALGCPEDTIRDIIVMDVAKNYTRRTQALRREQRAKAKYWENDRTDHLGNPNSPYRQIRVWNKEKVALLKDLLGPDIIDELEKNQMAGFLGFFDGTLRELSFLPADKRELVRELNDKYQQLHQEVYYKAKGDFGEETQIQLRALLKQKSAELTSLLTPLEFENYELRLSPSAENIRSQFEYFKGTEDEFRKLFRIQKAFDEKYAGYSPDPDDPAAKKQWQQAQAALQEAKTAALGERATTFTRSHYDDYQQIVKFAARESLAPGLPDKIYDLKTASEKEQARITADKTLTQEQRAAALRETETTTENTVKALIGEKNLLKFKEAFN